MPEKLTRTMTTIRLPHDLFEWWGEYAASKGLSKTRVVEELLTALREDRLRVAPRAGPNAFPADERQPGATRAYPALITPGVVRLTVIEEETEDA